MNKKSRKFGKILGISISSTPEKVLLKNVLSDIRSGVKTLIVTPNPEIVIQAQKDSKLMDILNKAQFSLVDGIGLAAACRFLSLPNPKGGFERALTLFVQGLGVGFSIIFNREWVTSEVKVIKGREFVGKLIKASIPEGFRIFLLGGEGNEAYRAAAVLRHKYPDLIIDSFAGPILTNDAVPSNKEQEAVENETIKRINKFKPDILFVGMSAPKQEKWLYRWLQKIDVKVAMTVGGTFKYLSGERVKPPAIFNNSGLEWLWRLSTGSQEIDRIGKAVWEFPFRVFMQKFNSRS